MTLNDLATRLTQYDRQEARSIVRLLLLDSFGITLTDICCGALDNLIDEQRNRLDICMKKLEKGEPIQYITGKAMFCEHEFHVEPGVLIPRPETEELVQMITNGKEILDIGTGSGCIAISLAMKFSDARVTAFDISEEALRIARSNAEGLGAKVCFKQQDALHLPADNGIFDVIVSNPPYICIKEADEMECNVLEHEPHIALFVPDNDPLVFYKAITAYASSALQPNGLLAFEVNPIYATETKELLEANGFHDTNIKRDAFGKDRIVYGTK